MANRDCTAIPNTTANEIQENITTHNILVITMITHYITEYINDCKIPHENSRDVMVNSKFHRTFSMLLLHLIQCPDLTFEELNNLISCGKYQLPEFFIKTYYSEVHRIINNDLDAIMAMFKNLDGNIIEHSIPKAHQLKIINNCSPIGIFVRRIMVFFNKMLFLQTNAVMKELKNCCNEILNKFPVR